LGSQTKTPSIWVVFLFGSFINRHYPVGFM